MSTVVRPVGPRGPRVYWIRRAILLAIVAVVVIVLAAECSGGSGKPSGSNQSGQNHPGASPSSTPTVPPCNTTALTLTVSTDTTHYTSGQAPKLIAVFANTGSTKCKLARSAANEIWTIKSGPAVVWTTQGCSQGTAPKKLKIAPGVDKTISMFWNGRLRNSSCQEGAVASAGHYTFDANLDGVAAGKPALFSIS